LCFAAKILRLKLANVTEYRGTCATARECERTARNASERARNDSKRDAKGDSKIIAAAKYRGRERLAGPRMPNRRPMPLAFAGTEAVSW